LPGAIADFTRAIELNPKVAWFYHGRGMARFDENQLDRALADFDKAIELDPQLAEAHANRGLTHLQKGSDAQAETDFARCLELNPMLRLQLEQKIAQTKALRTAKY
jgi:tetratricopeptide (TPR) repeat protein